MKREFAKIFLVDNGEQLLVTKDYEGEENKVICCADFKGVRASISLVFENRKAWSDCFKKFSQEQAQRMYEKMSSVAD
jgi:hypothetical protein